MKVKTVISGLVAIGVVLCWGSGADAQRLDFVESISGEVGLAGASALALSPDGSGVYIAGTNEGALAVFSRNMEDGTLSLVQSVVNLEFIGADRVTGMGTPTGVTLSPDGAHVYVTSRGTTLVVFARDPVTNELSYVETLANRTVGAPAGLQAPTDVVVSPDGTFVFVTSDLESSVTTFARNATTGQLTFVGLIERSVEGGVVGLGGARALAVSADGAHIYVAAPGEDGVGIFSVDEATGLLSFVGAVFDGVDGVDGLDDASDVVVSADGANVYAVGPNDSGLAVFDRDVGTGELTFLELQQNGFQSVEGLRNPRGVAASGDGVAVFATGFDANAAVSFARDADTGELTFASVARDGEGGVTGLEGATAVAVSPNPHHVYVASTIASAVTVFAIDPSGPPPVEPPDGPGLVGGRITYQYRFQAVDGDIFEGPTPFTVGEGVELIVNFGSTELDVSETVLKLTWTNSQALTPANFSGHIYSDATGALPAFESVTINPATTVAFDANELSFDEDNIWLNLAGLSADAGDMLALDITLMPEPGTASAVLGAAATLAWMTRRRRATERA